MTNQETLTQVEHGYRMARPRDCPDPIYEILLKTWAHEPEDRPTFEYLQNFFEDYNVSAEAQYQEQW